MIIKNNCKWLLQACPVEGGGEGGDGGTKVDQPFSKNSTKGLTKNAIQPKKEYTLAQFFTTFTYPPPTKNWQKPY